MIRWVDVAVTSTDKRLFVDVENTSNTQSTSTMSTWKIWRGIYVILRLKMVIRWTKTFQRLIHVDSTSKFTLRLVRRIFTSNRRRFYVEKYMRGYGTFFKVGSTSIQRWNFPIHKDCRLINVEYTSIPRWCFTHSSRRFFDVECTSIHRWFFSNQ